MKKYFVNEDWELDSFEDESDIFLLVVEQNIPACSYVHKYGINPDLLKPDYIQIVNQYKDTDVDGLLKIHLVKVPNTPQVQAQICCADSEHKGNTEDAIEAINAVLNRVDCEILESWHKEPLTEAKKKRRKPQYGDGTYLTFTTGYPELNDKFFNDRFDTSDSGGATSNNGCDSSSCDGGLGESLMEGKDEEERAPKPKRYIKRYYIRPQNVFASNKTEILARLAEIEGNNCSIYSLKSLEDHDDVHLLQPSDIIYYYDEGVLYDKNHIPVLDYNLNVKNEEERPRVSIDSVSDERLKDIYKDRVTDVTVSEDLELNTEMSTTNPPRLFMLYCHTNKYNNKKYFGITSQKDYSRWRNGEGYKNQPVFYAAIQKYGWDAFSHEIIKTNLTETEAKALEQEYIETYHTYINDPVSAGYNTTIGGESNLRYKTEEERQAAIKKSQHQTYLRNRETRLSAAKQQYWEDPDSYRTKNKLKYAQHKDQYLRHMKEHQAVLKDKLKLIRALNKLFPNRLSIEDTKKIVNFRHCRNADYINNLLSLFTEQEIIAVHEQNLLEALTEALTEDVNSCIICGEEFEGYGNNPTPVTEKGRCCDACNLKFVIPARLEMGKRRYEDN